MKQKNRRPGDILDDTAATLRIHFGRARTGRNSAIASMIQSANGTAVSTQRITRFRQTAGTASDIISNEENSPKLKQNVRKFILN
jgi:hypothetical protein